LFFGHPLLKNRGSFDKVYRELFFVPCGKIPQAPV
jgi:hypothetical protein